MSFYPFLIFADLIEVRKNLLHWKSVTVISRNGSPFQSEIPFIINRKYRGNLLTHILAMPKKKSITFEDAVRMTGQKFMESKKIGHNPGEALWYFPNFVEWISSLGYHIEITGDEFEAVTLPDKVS